MEVIEGLARHLDLDVDAVIDNLADFKTKSNFYSNQNMWKRSLTMNTITWWDFFLCQSATAPYRRTFVDFDAISLCIKIRNRLNNLRVEKEVAVKHNKNLCQTLSEEKRKEKHELSTAREKKIRAYPCVSLFDNINNDDDWSESEDEDNEDEHLWTSDEEIEHSSDEEINNNNSDDDDL
ncbi:Leucine--tRNA ligase 1 [Frankliniella fusca]|uniref:Leucine--tRNA ligase 1 n=1 Tax=Frankliniella fusca TaxID=407009 RepID=A0AAE1H6G9_9NEOP|nr:Leucine--tRNA ligase 1 [Frankliniella fusca]